MVTLAGCFFNANINKQTNPKSISAKVKAVASSQSAINILLLGTDERQGDAGRSDTTLVITLNTVSNQATVLSYHAIPE